MYFERVNSLKESKAKKIQLKTNYLRQKIDNLDKLETEETKLIEELK